MDETATTLRLGRSGYGSTCRRPASVFDRDMSGACGRRSSQAPALRAADTPIMLSRVTSAASCSSLMPSVLAGRMGSTR